jgi:hypothetical protein
MGSDDIFKRRKAQKAAELERQRRERAQGPRFLIVCEGMKTEPYYFDEFCQVHHLRTPRVRIAPGDEGSSPDCVVAHAEKLFDEDAKLGPDFFDKVFCVIDRDKHSTFKAAIQRIGDLSAEGKPFVAIPSFPCFEYWLLLHFTYTRQSFHAAGNRSICDNVIRELRKQPGFAGYAKAQRSIYSQLKDHTETAIKHAKRAEKEAIQTGENNPSTCVHHLVSELQSLAATHGRKR